MKRDIIIGVTNHVVVSVLPLFKIEKALVLLNKEFGYVALPPVYGSEFLVLEFIRPTSPIFPNGACPSTFPPHP